MKTFAKTLTLDAQFAHLYRPLARNLLLIIAAGVVLSGTALVYFDKHLVDSLSEKLIGTSARATGEKLHRLFDTASLGLRIARGQIGSLKIGESEARTRLATTFEPFLAEIDFLDSINLADSSGNEYVLIKQPGEVMTRQMDADHPGVANWRRRVDGKVVEEWSRRIDVSPKERPWYQNALEDDPRSLAWTSPYTFLTTKQPGVSVSSRWPNPAGDGEYVAAFNITLTDISRYTTHLRPSDHGMTVVFTQSGRTVGLPPDPRFDGDKALLAAVLSPVTQLGVPALDAALAAWEAKGKTEGIFRYRNKDRSSWWAGFSAIELDRDETVWSVALIPEDDLLGSVAQLRNLALTGILVTALLVAAVVFGTSMRSIRRQVRSAFDQVERRLGQYHLKQKIGEGGNGAVYRAQHALLRRPTAIKLMNAEFARSEGARERFEHEVQITSQLSHPNTIAIYDYGRTPDGTLYYAMELLDGGTVEQLVRVGGALPAGRVIHILEQMAGSLAEAHEKGLIHRDIKPSNTILCERGGLFDVVKVLDFGLVKEIAQTDGNLTQANVLIGTPLYMAPEIISEPGQASPQSDLYALGAVGYFLLTARNVFDGTSAVEICANHLSTPPVPPSQRAGLAVPEDLETLILGCLEKNPSRRPPNAASLRTSLLGCRDAGTWTQQDAREWWQGHSAGFACGSSPEQAPPLSNTEILIDLDARALSAET